MRLIVKTFTAAAAVAAYRLVAMASDTTVQQGAASTDLLIGVSHELPAVSGERLDVALQGIVEVEFGGTVPRGTKITSDASGKAIAAAPAAGVKAQIAGIALGSYVNGDRGLVLLSQSTLTG